MRFEGNVFYYSDEYGQEQWIAMQDWNGKQDNIVSVEPIGFLMNEALINTESCVYRAEWLKKREAIRMILIEKPTPVTKEG